jgi:hypothetical protein
MTLEEQEIKEAGWSVNVTPLRGGGYRWFESEIRNGPEPGFRGTGSTRDAAIQDAHKKWVRRQVK